MKLTIQSAQRVREKYLLEGEHEYLKRFPKDVTVVCEDFGGDKVSELPPEQQKEAHWKLVSAKRSGSECVVLLDERGKQFTSVELSNELQERMNRGTSQFRFLIGGAFGWNDTARKEADLVLSLSKLTFPNQLARLICVEQLYRVVSILKGMPYHK